MNSYDRYWHNREIGKCVRCGQPRGESKSKVFCAKCAEGARQRDAKKYEKCRKEGLCYLCMSPIGKDAQGHYCDKCREYMRLKRLADRKDKGEPKWTNESVAVKCVETGETWPSMKKAARGVGCSMNSIRNAIIRGHEFRGNHYRRVSNEGHES